MKRRLQPLILAAGMLTVLLANGCGNACLKLADQICGCQPDDASRANCQQRARDNEKIFNVRSQDEQTCQDLLDSGKCDCNKLDTSEGRANCGLAYTVAPDRASTR
jgi:GTP cyclohydrolase II